MGNLDWVEHFYGKTLLWRSRNRVYHPNIGVVIINSFLTQESIRQFSDLPELDDCAYAENYFNIDPHLMEDIKNTIVVLGADDWFHKRGPQFNLHNSGLNADALTWLHFISTNVQPTTHTSDITKEQALLIYLFMTAQRLKVENIISSSLTAACVADRRDAALIFPHLILDSFL